MSEQVHSDQNLTRREFIELAVASSFVAGLSASVMAAETRQGIPYRALGRTGEKVSAIGLGGYHVGSQADEQESIRIIRNGDR